MGMRAAPGLYRALHDPVQVPAQLAYATRTTVVCMQAAMEAMLEELAELEDELHRTDGSGRYSRGVVTEEQVHANL